MTEVTEKVWMYENQKPSIMWCRYSHSSILMYVPVNEHPIALKSWEHDENQFERVSTNRRYFFLTDDEVITMILPRII